MKIVIFLVFFFVYSNVYAKECGDKVTYCGVSIVNLLVEPSQFNNKIVTLEGFVHYVPSGPYMGYWVSIYNHRFILNSSVKLLIPQNAPQRNWIKSGSFYRVVGLFRDCPEVNCRPIINQIDNDPRIVIPLE